MNSLEREPQRAWRARPFGLRIMGSIAAPLQPQAHEADMAMLPVPSDLVAASLPAMAPMFLSPLRCSQLVYVAQGRSARLDLRPGVFSLIAVAASLSSLLQLRNLRQDY